MKKATGYLLTIEHENGAKLDGLLYSTREGAENHAARYPGSKSTIESREFDVFENGDKIAGEFKRGGGYYDADESIHSGGKWVTLRGVFTKDNFGDGVATHGYFTGENGEHQSLTGVANWKAAECKNLQLIVE